MESRVRYIVLETLRLVASAAGILLSGARFDGYAFAPAVQGCISTFAVGSLAALWIIFKQSSAAHGYLSHQ